ncbi:MAG: 50S ribosomal protein L3 [Verrucomicrobia bacterium]|jgi:large subunit ribosomal protein L3|nr:50S ribosomal protein L3 [Verrucomicrobiota bacterium]MBT7065850.1 50S ribosomal protein L3 [Verrucomicrobiota bacterium]MBT7698800.1 50S ribosomal protein L3 [Verrucomicrobiota bacterium]
MQALIGRKLGMTQVYDQDGVRVPVTVLAVGPCPVVQRKTRESDGYEAVQLGFGEAKESRIAKPQTARFVKLGLAPCRHLSEFRVEAGDEVKAGDILGADVFDGVTYVDVEGVTKGRGFAGVVKRYKMAGGRMTHGGHARRRVGSIGQCSYPARVAKGQRMPGHMGHVKVTTQNLKVVEVRGEDNLLLVRGAVPGPKGAIITVRKALKKGASAGGKG